MDGNEELQLLPGTKKRLGIKIPGENRFLYLGSAILGAAIVASFWFNLEVRNTKNEIAEIEKQTQELELKRDKKTESNIVFLQRQLASTSKLVNDHFYFSQAILKISSLIPDKVQIDKLFIERDGKVAISGSATSYTVIAQQVAVLLADNSVIDMSLGAMSSQTDGTIGFNMQIEFNADKLLHKKK